MNEFARTKAKPGDSLSADFMHALNESLERDDQELYQQAVTKLFETGLIGLTGTSLQLTERGWAALQNG